MGIFPRIMILDGVSLYSKLRHKPGDLYRIVPEHDGCELDKGGQMVKVTAGELCAEYMFTTAKLA
eukprot:9485725-Pyramimonas_sp.AAC.1